MKKASTSWHEGVLMMLAEERGRHPRFSRQHWGFSKVGEDPGRWFDTLDEAISYEVTLIEGDLRRKREQISLLIQEIKDGEDIIQMLWPPT